MSLSAIWCKLVQVSFFKDNKIAKTQRESAICSLKNLQVPIYTKLHEKSCY